MFFFGPGVDLYSGPKSPKDTKGIFREGVAKEPIICLSSRKRGFGGRTPPPPHGEGPRATPTDFPPSPFGGSHSRSPPPGVAVGGGQGGRGGGMRPAGVRGVRDPGRRSCPSLRADEAGVPRHLLAPVGPNVLLTGNHWRNPPSDGSQPTHSQPASPPTHLCRIMNDVLAMTLLSPVPLSACECHPPAIANHWILFEQSKE